MENIYESGYFILTSVYLFDKNMIYTDKKRLVILYFTYPLIAYSCYCLSVAMHSHIYNLQTLYYIFLVSLLALIINYFQQPELYFDIDDSRRYIIMGILCFTFLGKILLINKLSIKNITY